MTSYTSSFRRTVLPTISGSAANWLRHRKSESTTTRCPPGTTLSAGPMTRPMAGRTPSTEKKAPDTISPSCRSGNAPPATVMKTRQNAARSTVPSSAVRSSP